jgi:hypothetical protein
MLLTKSEKIPQNFLNAKLTAVLKCNACYIILHIQIIDIDFFNARK